MYDVIVIGARPAGLAATYALHHHLNTLVQRGLNDMLV